MSTLGILYRVGSKEGEESQGLRAALRADPNFSPLIAFVFMLFHPHHPALLCGLGHPEG